eukprot:1474820-Rhodomonas_salina.3
MYGPHISVDLAPYALHTACHGPRMPPCPVLTSLCTGCAMSGTDIGYGASRPRDDVQYNNARDPRPYHDNYRYCTHGERTHR